MLSSASSLLDWLAWLETLSPKEIDLGLERVCAVLDRLALAMPDDILLIAGTNGKGSSVAIADGLLRASGKTVGAYTSPHIHFFNERIVIAGKTVSDATLIAAFETVEAARGDTKLTYFEFTTLAATVVFAAARLDVWVLEIGLGGRLDACNAFAPSASLITNVTLDHCDWLGNDVETIATEKAGVMRAGRPTIFGSNAMPDSVGHHALRSGAVLLKVGSDFDFEICSNATWSWRGPSRSMDSLLAPGLQGDFQVGNAAAVLALLDAAGLADNIDAALVNQVLPRLSLAGRLQSVAIDGGVWLFDVAHNPAAATALAANLGAHHNVGSSIAVVGILKDKDLSGIVEPLLEQVHQWVAVTADNPRAIDAIELGRQIANLGGRPCYIAQSIADGVEFARRSASENDRILVTGSFFTVAPVMDYLQVELRTET